MDTAHLRAVVAVAAHGSFTAAAQHMYMSQSAVSRHVAAVERALERQLFVRGPRRVRLTPAGSAFLPGAELSLSALSQAMADAHAAGHATEP